jgi:hypothetical protein
MLVFIWKMPQIHIINTPPHILNVLTGWLNTKCTSGIKSLSIKVFLDSFFVVDFIFCSFPNAAISAGTKKIESSNAMAVPSAENTPKSLIIRR